MPTLSDAIATIKAGRREEGRVMLTRILVQEGNNVTALLWMSEVAKTPEERRACLKRILAIDPDNAPARKGLELLDKAEKPLPSTATQPLTRLPTSADAADDHRMSPDERKPQQVPKRSNMDTNPKRKIEIGVRSRLASVEAEAIFEKQDIADKDGKSQHRFIWTFDADKELCDKLDEWDSATFELWIDDPVVGCHEVNASTADLSTGGRHYTCMVDEYYLMEP
jgi:hypothetical protein